MYGLKLRYAYLTLFVGSLFYTACSRKNDAFINRNFHAVTTEFNTLYNGNVALEEGQKQLISSFEENYWDVLPVEQLEFDADAFLTEKEDNPAFAKAEEKAIKAIQKHSMQIDGKERNPQIDEAFMVLGKARYFEQNYVPALEAFNYILQFYPSSNTIWQATVWKAKTNMRMDNNEVAIQVLEKARLYDLMDRQDKADVHSALSQAYYNQEKIDTALLYIKEAVRFARKPEERGRYAFIKAQLYEKLGHKDSARMAYDEVIDLNRKIPRKYWINAQLAKIENIDFEKDDTLGLWEHIVKLRDNREHRPFKDRIFYTIANYYTNIGKRDSAVAWHNRSLRQNSSDKYLISRNYLSIGEYHFDNANYQTAGAYYDSTLTQLKERSREHRRIRKKRENLDDVIEYELLAARNDSILSLVAMSDEERTTYFNEYIERLKEKERQDSIAAAKALETDNIRNNEFFDNSSSAPGARKGEVGQFYFYNTTAVAYGKQSFERRWGKREFKDNWRISARTSGNTLNAVGAAGVTDAGATNDSLRYDINTYIASIPTKQQSIDSLKTDRDFAYFQLGLIYKEKFKEFPLAIDRLETLLTFDPTENLVLPSKYNLYQLYGEVDAFAKAESQKRDITSNYSDSRYAAILNNPEAALEKDAEGPDARYENTFENYLQGDYLGALQLVDQNIERFYGDPILPKFELLKARIIGRLDGPDAYKAALETVALTYPRIDEGKMAQRLIDEEVPKLIKPDFIEDVAGRRWKLLYKFNTDQDQAIMSLTEDLQAAFDVFAKNQFKFTVDTYDRDTQFLVVHGLFSKDNALETIQKLAIPEMKEVVEGKGRRKKTRLVPKYKAVTVTPDVINSRNYGIITVHKNYQEYVDLQTN